LSPINEGNESKNAKKRWSMLRQAVKANSQRLRNARARNVALLKLVRNLNTATEKAAKTHATQMNRLEKQAAALHALRDPNYINARYAALQVHKKALRQLHGARNKVFNELMRNSTSSKIRRNLYAEGLERGRHGTSQNNWQNWTNKLWHEMERRRPISSFF
jgi:hypothetical protein